MCHCNFFAVIYDPARFWRPATRASDPATLSTRSDTGLLPLPGVLCMTTGSQPELLVLVDLVACAGVPKLFWSVNDG